MNVIKRSPHKQKSKERISCKGFHQSQSKFLVLVLICACLSIDTSAQNADTVIKEQSSALSFDADGFIRNLPPVEALIDSAITRAPDIRSQEINIRQSQLDIRDARTRWTKDIVNAGGTLNYGKLNDLYLSDMGTAGQIAATTSTQTRYSVGVSVRIPISALFHRYDYKTAKIDLEQSESRKQGLINSIREEVLSRYNSLLSNYQTYNILFENFDDQDMILQTAEKDFITNQISLGDLSNIRISYAKAKVDLSKARYEFQKSLWMLEEIVGFKIGD